MDAKYQVSDSAGFAGPDNLAYFAGGYNLTYGAFPTLFTIDPVATKKANATLVVKERAPMPTARGDLAAVTATYNIAHYALVAGGFTDENLFCAPLAVTERYNFADDTWSASKDLVLARADMAMVTLSNRIFAIAGERQITNICNISKDNLPDPGDQTVPIDDVEWFNETTDEWSVIMDLPQHRFRFAAIGYQDAIYSFGGQLAFDKSCQCFKTTDEVVVYTQSFVNSTSDAGTTMKSTADAATSTKWGALLLASGIALWVY